MSNNDLKVMMAAMLPLEEPMRPRKNRKVKRVQERPWELNEKAKARYIQRLNSHWKGENDA